MAKKESNLVQVLGVLNETELKILSTIAAKQELIGTEIRRLRNARYRRSPPRERNLDLQPSQLGGVDENWVLWVENQLRMKNIELAKTKADFEEQKQACLLSIGRKNAFDGILKNNQRLLSKRLNKRLNW